MHQFYERFHLASATNICDFPNKDQLMTYLQDRLHKDEQYIEKMEVISEDNVKNWIAQDSTNNYILEYLFRTNLEKVINVESQLVIHQVTAQMMELVNYRTIAEDVDVWGEYVASLVGPS